MPTQPSFRFRSIIFNTTTNTLNFYDGSSWGSFFSQGGNPVSFGFTDQTGVTPSTTITSNAVTLSGFPGSLTATCTGCTAIARNGAWGGTSVSGFMAGDTIAIRVAASASYATAVAATVTVGGTVSQTWTVTTVSAIGPSAFSFTDVTGATTGVTYTSNATTLTGFSGSLAANCTNCISMSRNGGAWSASPLAGFVSGDTIALRMNAGATPGGTVNTTVTVGSTTSTPWSITATNGCGVTTTGAACPDGSIVAGFSPDGNVLMYTTPCDAGMTWDSGTSSCTGSRTTMKWSTFATQATGYTSAVTGRANTAALAILVHPDMPFPAASYCDNLSAYGHSDWYMPAKDELTILYTNRAVIGGFDVSGAYYWSASESSVNNLAYYRRFSDGNMNDISKLGGYPVRCVRR